MGKFVKVRISKWTSDFRGINLQDASEYGVTYGATKQAWCTLHRHESLDNIYNTLHHESVHQAIIDDITGAPDESESMDGEQEHELMLRLFWVYNGWVTLDDNISISDDDILLND